MASILPQMRGNAVGAGRFADKRGFRGVRFAFFAPVVTSFSNGGDVVDVDTQLQHGWR
jgi:hypothetical protein